MLGHVTKQKSKLLLSIAMAGLALTAFAGVSPAQAVEACAPGNVWLNSYDETTQGGTLVELAVDPTSGALTEVNSFTTERPYGDIALTPDGQNLYGVTFFTTEALIAQLDMTSGAVISEMFPTPVISVDGMPVIFNALSFAPDGTLYASGPLISELFSIDPNTGLWSQPSLHDFPQGTAPAMLLYSAGDFLTLPDGDVLAVLTNANLPDGPWTYLARMDIGNGTSSIVAKMSKQIYGAAQSGDRIYLAASDGTVYSMDTVPVTGDENNDITAQLSVAWTSNLVLWGATSQQDIGGCQVPVTPVQPEAPAVPARVETAVQ